MSNNTSPWDYALINLRRLIYEKGLSNSSLVKAYVRANSVAMAEKMSSQKELWTVNCVEYAD